MSPPSLSEILVGRRAVVVSRRAGLQARRRDNVHAMYIALAEAVQAPLVTCDGALAKAPGHRARIEVIE
jgi:predicted nucleic acid-binding protein